MILAGVLIVAGAAWLYWPAGDSTPTGLGEQQTVVTNLPDNVTSTGETGPSSGDVDINHQTTALTPEKAEGENVPSSRDEDKIEEKPDPVVQEPVVQQPAVKKTVVKKPTPPAPRIEPSTSGTYAVQTGSFGNAENSDKEATRLKTLGWNTSIRAGNNSSGQMVFRVWITYFKSRQDAQTFINQNAKHVPGAIPVQR